MELLPDQAEREHLLDELAHLIETAGSDGLVSCALIEPSDRWFPDRWTADAAGVERLLRRLLGYATLGELGLTIEVDRFSESVGKVLMDGSAGGHQGTAAWFAGIHDGVCAFGLDVHQLDDPIGLIGTLAHEVAHAYRHENQLVQPVREHEERLTDLTTVYLGFGILTVNATQRFRSGLDSARSWYSRAQGGYLSMQAMSYLLAAQVVARDEAVGPIARALTSNQRACFKAACKQLGARATILDRLGLPAVSTSSERRGGWFRRLWTR